MRLSFVLFVGGILYSTVATSLHLVPGTPDAEEVRPDTLLLTEVGTYLSKLPKPQMEKLGRVLAQTAAMQDIAVQERVRLAQTEITALNDQDLETVAEFLVHLREEELHVIAEVVRGEQNHEPPSSEPSAKETPDHQEGHELNNTPQVLHLLDKIKQQRLALASSMTQVDRKRRRRRKSKRSRRTRRRRTRRPKKTKKERKDLETFENQEKRKDQGGESVLKGDDILNKIGTVQAEAPQLDKVEQENLQLKSQQNKLTSSIEQQKARLNLMFENNDIIKTKQLSEPNQKTQNEVFYQRFMKGEDP